MAPQRQDVVGSVLVDALRAQWAKNSAGSRSPYVALAIRSSIFSPTTSTEEGRLGWMPANDSSTSASYFFVDALPFLEQPVTSGKETVHDDGVCHV